MNRLRYNFSHLKNSTFFLLFWFFINTNINSQVSQSAINAASEAIEKGSIDQSRFHDCYYIFVSDKIWEDKWDLQQLNIFFTPSKWDKKSGTIYSVIIQLERIMEIKSYEFTELDEITTKISGFKHGAERVVKLLKLSDGKYIQIFGSRHFIDDKEKCFLNFNAFVFLDKEMKLERIWCDNVKSLTLEEKKLIESER